ncbi:hypothetical protein EH223_10630 [candidate division KSB1 bacterium]|nr:hypothetical protein [candidate division KSB1 bacterium]RQW03210.1 MAG: hypothetical protein EH223_10630 [candidate division KSB1 bacterium]
MVTKSLIGIASVFLWLVVFLPGLTISSMPYRAALQQSITFENLFMTLLTYTVTNVAILCCIAGMIGAMTRDMYERVTERRADKSSARAKKSAGLVIAGVLRSFLIYILFLSGVYLATNAPFENTTPQQYVRVAGLISVFAFLVGYDPKLFTKIVDSFASTVPQSRDKRS